MATKIAINGFGRIGRLSFRKMFEDDKFDVENETVHNAVEDGDKADAESKSNE